MPKYAVTFCNSGGAKLAIIDQSQISRTLELDPARLTGQPTSVTGATIHQSRLVVAVHSSPCMLAFLGENLIIEKVIKIPQSKDIHGIFSLGDQILVASSGTNQILSVNTVTSEIKTLWFNGDSLSDTIHLNDLFVFDGKIYSSRFGAKLPDELRSGEIREIIDGTRISGGLREPHSVTVHENDIYVLESASGDLVRFAKGFAPQRVLGVFSYARGLAINATHFAIGKSGYRKDSRHGVGDARTPPIPTSEAAAEWLGLSGVFIIERSTLNSTFIDTTSFGSEIYQVLQLPDEFVSEPKQPYVEEKLEQPDPIPSEPNIPLVAEVAPSPSPSPSIAAAEEPIPSNSSPEPGSIGTSPS